MGKHVLTYPWVRSEEETIAAVSAGNSLARFGDGELKLILNGSALREPANPELGEELRAILRKALVGLTVGIPTLNISGPKYENWRKHADRFCSVLHPGMEYFSAFVSRPDSAPWIETREYAESVERIWRGKRVCVIAERSGFMVNTVARGAAHLTHVECPRFNAYSKIDFLQKHTLRAAPEIVIMAAGPTATCLAARFAREGLQAVDLGSAGRFIYRTLWPEEFAALNSQEQTTD